MKILLIMKNAVLSFFIFSMVFFQLNCLRPKKSAFDTSSSSGLFFAGILFSTTGVTVGGSISGHSSGTLILKNGNDEKKIEPNTANYSFSVSRNSTYSISISSYPEGLSCAVENATGTASGTVTNANVKCSALVFQTLFANNGKNWNDYIQRDYSKSLLSQADTACNPTSGSNENYFSCIHAAEIRSLELPAGV
ncbi:MAG: hypothetical protein SFU98_16745, partial [Leptospiraceae bacterium]|nr:hypothetical protein [Leptospiraceae bacterium]